MIEFKIIQWLWFPNKLITLSFFSSPIRYEREESELVLDGNRYFIKLHDTAGQEDFDRLRLVIYKDTDVFILCYSMDNRTSFENIFSKWYPELSPYNKPIILVGKFRSIELKKKKLARVYEMFV